MAPYWRSEAPSRSLTLNVLTSTLEDQLALLDRARNLGLEFFVELGNEIYWGKYADWRGAARFYLEGRVEMERPPRRASRGSK